MLTLFNRGTLQQRIVALVLLVVVITLFIIGWATSTIVYQNMKQDLGSHALEIARFIAHMDTVKDSMNTERPWEILQPLANRWLSQTRAGFIVVLNKEGVRYSHPRPELIGRHFTGEDEGPALLGEEYISETVGISGPSIRGFSPIYDEKGSQLGTVAVGMFKHNIDTAVKETQFAILRALILGLVIGIPGAVMLAKTVKKTMYGMEPKDIATLLQQREALLNCVKEGIIFTDKTDTVALVNQSARELLNLPANIIGKPILEAIPSSRMPQVRKTGTAEYNQQQKINEVIILTNRKPVIVDNEVVGVVATFSDKTEMQNLAEELTGVQRYVQGLRAKSHEFMNKLQAISGLLELEEYDEARHFIAQTTKRQQKILSFLTKSIKDPATLGFLLGKIREGEEQGIQCNIKPGSLLKKLPANFPSEAMVLVLGNLLDNSFEAINEAHRPGTGKVTVSIRDEPQTLEILVEDNGTGINTLQKDQLLKKGFSTKEGDRGYGLFLIKRQVEEFSGGVLDIANRPRRTGTVVTITIPKKEVD
ncbi:MAG: ATP-binding protein [Peptococcaceae bacterium]